MNSADSAAQGTATGVLRLGVERAPSGRSVAVRQFHAGALRVMRPHYPDDSGQPVFTVVNPGGAYLGADTFEVEYDGGPGSSALLTTQSATKVYRTPQGPARQIQRFSLGPGARLEYVPDALIAYDGAVFHQSTEVELTETSSLFLAESTTAGWSPDGAPFRFREIRLTTRVLREGRPLLWDNLVLRPELTPPGTTGWLEGHTHLLSVVAVHPDLDERVLQAVRGIAVQHPQLEVGVSLLDGPGLLLRALGTSSQPLTELAREVGAWLRADQTGQDPWDLRKH